MREIPAREFVEQHADRATFVVSPLGRVLAVNERYVRLLTFDDEKQALDTNLGRLFPDQATKYRFMKQLFEIGRVRTDTIRLRLLDGSRLNVQIEATSRFDREGFLDEIRGFVLPEGP